MQNAAYREILARRDKDAAKLRALRTSTSASARVVAPPRPNLPLFNAPIAPARFRLPIVGAIPFGYSGVVQAGPLSNEHLTFSQSATSFPTHGELRRFATGRLAYSFEETAVGTDDVVAVTNRLASLTASESGLTVLDAVSVFCRWLRESVAVRSRAACASLAKLVIEHDRLAIA
jgi:hypothetical protein